MFPNLVFQSADGFAEGAPATGAPDIDDMTPPSLANMTIEGSGLFCEVCGTPLTYSGRGRKPKRCDEHKRQMRTRETGGGTTSRKRTITPDARGALIVEDLQEGAGMLAGTISTVAPVTGYTMMAGSPDAITAIVKVASRYPKLLDGLEKAAQGMPFLEIGKFAAALILALSVDLGRVYPAGLAAEYLGVATAAREVGWQPPQEQSQEPEPGFYAATPPPQFTMR